jgi:uncharacterized protein YkwD
VRLVPSVRRALLAAVTATLIVPAGASAACKGADAPVTRASLPQARQAVLCLHNAVRRAHDLPALRADADLGRAATRYSAQMVRGRFFDHVSPSGSTLLGRVKATAYLSSSFGFALGENIAWGQSWLSTPRSIMRGWMHSAGHRHNILTPSYRDLGIGIAPGTPAGSMGATYTADFGARG